MRFLIVKTSSLGDIIHATPFLERLKELFPSAEIDWVVEKSFFSLLQGNPLISSILTIESKKWKRSVEALFSMRRVIREKNYDAVFDLQGNCKSGLITFSARSSHKIGFGFKTVPEFPNCFVTYYRYNPPQGKNIREDLLFLLDSFLEEKIIEPFDHQLVNAKKGIVSKEPYLLIAPFSKWENKQLSQDQLERFLVAVSTYTETAFLISFGSDQEEKQARVLEKRLKQRGVSQVSLLPKLSLKEFREKIQKVEGVIAMDSLPLHLAAYMKCATFSFFGPSSSHKYAPFGKEHMTYQGTCPYGEKFEKRCKILRSCKTGACMKEMDMDTAFLAFQKWWQQREAKRV